MTTNKLQPIHPGEILRNKYMKPMALSANALALRVPATRMGKPSSWRYLKRGCIRWETEILPVTLHCSQAVLPSNNPFLNNRCFMLGINPDYPRSRIVGDCIVDIRHSSLPGITDLDAKPLNSFRYLLQVIDLLPPRWNPFIPRSSKKGLKSPTFRCLALLISFSA